MAERLRMQPNDVVTAIAVFLFGRLMKKLIDLHYNDQ